MIDMTQSEFTSFYPQFVGFTPAIVMTTYIQQANARFSMFSPEDMEEARRLYVAHKLTLYSTVALPDGATPTKAAIAAVSDHTQQRVSSKKVGEVAVTYSYGSSSHSASTEFADLTETPFGLQLLTLIRLYSYSRYVP